MQRTRTDNRIGIARPASDHLLGGKSEAGVISLYDPNKSGMLGDFSQQGSLDE
jgi:hypothetical protein